MGSSTEDQASDRWAPLRELVEQVVRREAVDGAAVTVALAGELVVEHGYGVAAKGQAVTPDTLWPWGRSPSCTRQPPWWRWSSGAC